MWKLNKNGVTPSVTLTPSEQKNLNDFMGGIQKGEHPATVASAWSANYKRLQDNQFQIRLSGSNRATFTVDETTKTVTMLQVGGHS